MAEWLTLDELAAYLKRGRTTLYRMARNGQIPATKIGRTWRFDRGAIDEWMRQQSSQVLPTRAETKRRRTRRNAP